MVIPRHADVFCVTLEIVSQYNTPIIPRGVGSSLSGQTIGSGLIIDHSKFINRILTINTEEKWVEAETGVALDVLNAQLLKSGLMVGPDPTSSAVATIGGMTGNNSTGAHSFKYGMFAADHVHELEAVLVDGRKALFNEKTLNELDFLSPKSALNDS